MKRHRLVMSALLVAAAVLSFAACGGGGGSSKSADPVEVLKQYYAAVNAQDVDKALSYFAADAVAANANGDYYRGIKEIRTLLESGASSKLTVELTNPRAKNGRVRYDFKVKQGDTLIDQGTNGLTIVRDGKITFDGSVATEP